LVVGPTTRLGPDPGRVAEISDRIRELAADYEPPTFAEVPGPDAALFLSAIDHRTGYRAPRMVGGKGPYEGSALLWALGLEAEGRRPGTLSADGLTQVSEDGVGEMFRVAGETAAGADVRARLWRDLAAGLRSRYGGSTENLIAAAEGCLGGSGGLLALLGEFEAFADPVQKKSFLFCKIAERRGWLRVEDPESWQVCADNVLMRLALRSGLVHPGPEDVVRAATRDAFKAAATAAGVPPPILDDLLWERGREDPDLLGCSAGDLREPERPTGTHWY
jgi:hypothetical protein